jgi:alpha-aminoadipate/glutamate carrier protein LysW
MTTTCDCLVCDAALETHPDMEKGEIVECSSCGQEHEVVTVTNTHVSVEMAPEVEEDWGE